MRPSRVEARGSSHARLIVALSALSLLPLSVKAGPGDSQGMDLLARHLTGNPHASVIRDGLGYLAMDSGLGILDLGDPSAPRLVGHLNLASPARDVVLSGGVALVACSRSGLCMVDVTNPEDPRLLAKSIGGDVRGVAVRGPTAYVAQAALAAAGGPGLRLVDVSTPAMPVDLGFLPLANGALCVANSSDLVVVGLGAEFGLPGGIAIVDVSAPAAPTLLGRAGASEAVHDVALQASFAYAATGPPLAGHLRVFDISSPSAPNVVAEFSLGDTGRGVAVAGDRAWVAAGLAGLATFDLSRPAEPALLDLMSTGRFLTDVSEDLDLALLAERSSWGASAFSTVDLPSFPGLPNVLGSRLSAEVSDVATQPGLAVVLRRDGVDVLDTIDPADPQTLGSWTDLEANLSALAMSEDLVVVTDGSRIRILDIVEDGDPTELSSLRVSDGAAVDLAIELQTLFLADGLGLQIIDLSVPSAPESGGTYTGVGLSSAVAVDGGHAYLAGTRELRLLDVSAPATPVSLGQLLLPSPAYGVDAKDGLAVVCGQEHDLLVVDVTTPMAPVLLGSLPGGPAFDVRLSGDRAVIAAGERGVLVVNLDDPSAPFLEAWYESSGMASRLSLDGRSVHVATGASQHFVLGCDACISTCNVSADITPPSAELCSGDGLNLVAGGSMIANCPTGQPDFQWYQDGSSIPGATDASLVIPPGLADGDYVFRVDMVCATEPDCVGSATSPVHVGPGTWPNISHESLRMVKTGDAELMSWEVINWDEGEANLHRSLDPKQLQPSLIDPFSVATTRISGTTTLNEYSAAVGEAIFFRVFPRDSCTGETVTSWP